MSYTRHYHTTISVYYSDSVDYPASEHGGTKYVSGYVDEPIDITVEVDTDNFDDNVDHCNGRIENLTDAVVATEAAQVASVRLNSRRVAQTIVDGFFKTVRSDISQQITELKTNVDTTLAHLNQLMRRCLQKREQMQADYNRITSRYTKLFDDLDRELHNRIHDLDKPVFDIREKSARHTGHLDQTDAVTTVAVSFGENSHLHAAIGASKIKKLTSSAIGTINDFLSVQKATDLLIARSTVPAHNGDFVYKPVMVFDSVGDNGTVYRSVYAAPDTLNAETQRVVENSADSVDWKRMDEQNVAFTEGYLNASIDADIPPTSAHNQRVRQMMQQLYNNDKFNI